MSEVVAILNPKAGGGRVRRRWPAFEAAIREWMPQLQTLWTERPWHAAELTREALLAGADLVLAIGGDGTVHEVVNGFLDNDMPVRTGARLGYIPMGTGGDFQRTIQVPQEPIAVAAYLAEGSTVAMDVGKVRFLGESHEGVEQRYFANLLSFGMGGDVSVVAKNNALTDINGQAAFLWATLKVSFSYPGKTVLLEFDAEPPLPPIDITNVAVGNGQYHGGGMLPCPGASLVDGLLDVTVIERLSWFELIRGFRTLYSGAIHNHQRVQHRKVARLIARSVDQTRVEVDGEAAGSLPIEIEVLPRIIPVVRPTGSPLR
jgi:diacylglycerol kinase (ATP)